MNNYIKYTFYDDDKRLIAIVNKNIPKDDNAQPIPLLILLDKILVVKNKPIATNIAPKILIIII